MLNFLNSNKFLTKSRNFSVHAENKQEARREYNKN
jgi:hypothetical protein